MLRNAVAGADTHATAAWPRIPLPREPPQRCQSRRQCDRPRMQVEPARRHDRGAASDQLCSSRRVSDTSKKSTSTAYVGMRARALLSRSQCVRSLAPASCRRAEVGGECWHGPRRIVGDVTVAMVAQLGAELAQIRSHERIARTSRGARAPARRDWSYQFAGSASVYTMTCRAKGCVSPRQESRALGVRPGHRPRSSS
jgi:hypothetical protein